MFEELRLGQESEVSEEERGSADSRRSGQVVQGLRPRPRPRRELGVGCGESLVIPAGLWAEEDRDSGVNTRPLVAAWGTVGRGQKQGAWRGACAGPG